MFPLFNSLPFHGNANPSSAPQRVMGNPGNFAPNTMQIQAQIGMPNPQTAIPLGNSNSHFAPNQFFPMQAPQNMNYPVAVNQMNTMNSHPQSMPQSFAQSSAGPSKFFNQYLNLGFPNPVQDMNQILQLQMLRSLYTQVVPANLNLPQNLAFVANSQPANLNLHQNAAFAANTQLGFVNSSGFVQQSANTNASNGIPNAVQQLQGSSSLVQGFAPVPQSQNQKNFHQPSKFQGNNRNVLGTRMIRNNGKSPQNKNFKGNAKHDTARNGFVRPQIHKRQNNNGNFKSRNMQLRRGNDSSGERQISDVNSAVQAQVEKKRSISLNYTEKEIQEWREERRKNYPSKSNIEKKLMEKLTKPEVSDKVAKLRRQQLKEILAKQAALGCEVAEIPSHYLSDSEQQLIETKESGKELSKKGKFQNKFNNKRGRFNQNDRFSYKKGFGNDNSSSARSKNDSMTKKQRLANDNSVTHHAFSRREPTLLQKLLTADVRRDRHHLLQVFKFMVMNSFFKDGPEKPLKFPVVIVKETTNEDELVEENSVEGKKNCAEGILGKIEGPIVSEDDDIDDDDDDDDDNENGNEKPKSLEADSLGGEPQEEEGEIID